MSSTRKICQLCGKRDRTHLSVGTKAGNEIIARNILYEYQTYGSECFVDPRVMGWSGEPNDHKSITEFFIRNNASFHLSCRKQFSDREVQRNREKRAAAYAPIAAASQLAVEEEHVIQEIAGSSDEPTETNQILAAEEVRDEPNTSFSSQVVSDLADTPSTEASQWTPGRRLIDDEDITSTPKRPCTSRRVRLMRALLAKMTDGGIYSRTQLFNLYNEIVSSSISDRYKGEEIFFDEKTFLSSVKTHIGEDIVIEHDGSWRYVMICSKQNLHGIMKQAFEKEQGSFSVHFDLQHVRNSIVNCTSGGRFAGSFSEEIIEQVSAPVVLRETVSYLCYGVPGVESFDILSISNSIYYNHRKKPDVLKVVSYIKVIRCYMLQSLLFFCYMKNNK